MKDKVKERDGNCCRRCGFDKNLHVHHIMPRSKYPLLEDFSLNMVTLCGNCHSLLKGKETHTDLRGFLPNDLDIDKQLIELRETIDSFMRIPIEYKWLLEGKSWVRRKQKKKAERYFNQGKKKYKNGEYKSAIEFFDCVVWLESDNADAYFQRGMTKLELEKYQSAIYDFNEATSLRPDNADAYFRRGSAKLKLEKYRSACNDFNVVLHLDTEKSEVHYERGRAKFYMGLFNDAIEDFNEALRLKPDDVYYRACGLSKCKIESFGDAIADFDEGIELIRDRLNAIFQRAKNLKNNWKDRAKEKVFSLQRLHINRGDAKKELGRIDEAMQDFQTALDLAPLTKDPKYFKEHIEAKIEGCLVVA